MGKACARCGQERGADERWCSVCGLDFSPTAATLPTPEAIDAGNRERAWFEAHPEAERAAEARREAAEQEQERAELDRISKIRPAGYDEYRDVSWRARLARGWLLIVAALSVLSAVLEIRHLNLVAGKSTADIDVALAQRIDDDNSTLAIVDLITFSAYVLSAMFFIAWTFRAYKNAIALGAQHRRFGAGWAIGGWFVPILAFWRPKQIVNDAWRASDPDDPPIVADSTWHHRRVPLLLTAWWALFLLGNILDNVSARIPSDTVEHNRASISWGLAGSIVALPAALLAVRVVSEITNRQRLRAAALEALPTG